MRSARGAPQGSWEECLSADLACGTPWGGDTPLSRHLRADDDVRMPGAASAAAVSAAVGRGDRLVPDRHGMAGSVGVALYQSAHPGGRFHAQPPPQSDDGDGCGESYKLDLACSLFGAAPHAVADKRVLPIGGAEKDERRGPLAEHDRNLRVIFARNRTRNFRSRAYRYIPQTPERILDAPDMVEDYYVNLLDWSASNVLSVALQHTVYLWNADTGDTTSLMQTSDSENIVTGISFSKDAPLLAVGTNSADVEVWDVAAGARTGVLKGHIARVAALAWNGSVVASGSRDATVNLHDIRVAGGPVATLCAHEQDVCGLRWSLDGTQLASGGNDNLLHIWDDRQRRSPRLRLTEHTAAVRALGWSPHRSGLLASGGGTADRTIRFWDTTSGECINAVDTNSQVCALLWSVHRDELLTSHGYSEFQLSMWKYPSMKRTASLTGHSSRVLHLALSPDGQTVVSAAADETIRFWHCFAEELTKRKKVPKPGILASSLMVR